MWNNVAISDWDKITGSSYLSTIGTDKKIDHIWKEIDVYVYSNMTI